MRLTSPAFEHKEVIPARHSCRGEDVSPALSIEDIPPETQSLVLIVDDPDAPRGTFVHWVVFNIAVTDAIAQGEVPGTQGMNDFGRQDWGGPCPPSGTHRYFFKLYALDCELGLGEEARKDDVEQAMSGHVLAQTELIGLFSR